MDTDTQAVEAIKALTHELPLNDFGLPVGIYRADLLPFHDYVPPSAHATLQPIVCADVEEPSEALDIVPYAPSEGSDSTNDANGANGDGEYRIAGFPAKSLNQAFVPLQYDEGFPAFSDGSPFWSRLECEPHDIFVTFDRYLKMPLGRVADLEDEEDFGEAASGTRSLSALITRLHPDLADNTLLRRIDQYRAYFYLYYWGMRAHAYDLFRVAQHQKQQELRALETQDEHYVDARRIRARIMKYMTSDTEFWDLMTPKVATDLLKLTTGLERISAGIPLSGPSPNTDDNRHATFEIAFRTLAQSSHPQTHVTIDGEGEMLSEALKDPEATKLLQELIIRSGN